MADIKAGTVVFVRTTEEPVFVLSVYEAEDSFALKSKDLSGRLVDVRRPVQGRDGIVHETATFHLEELETKESREGRLEEVLAGLRGITGKSGMEMPEGLMATKENWNA